MAPKRPRATGSSRGRPTIDWEEAFVYFASLPSPERSYSAVAAAFKVSARTVERHGREEAWHQRLRGISAQAAAKTDAQLGEKRAEQHERLIKLVEATLVGYADKLRRGDLRMTPADLDRLHKLWQQLSDELGQPSQPEPANQPGRAPDDVAAVVAALTETGALEALGLQTIPPPHSTDEPLDLKESREPKGERPAEEDQKAAA